MYESHDYTQWWLNSDVDNTANAGKNHEKACSEVEVVYSVCVHNVKCVFSVDNIF